MYHHQLDTIDMQKATALYCEGMQITNIAQSLSTDEQSIHQMLSTAEQLDYFTYRPTLTLPELEFEVQDFVYHRMLTIALSDTLKNRIEFAHTPIIITPSPKSMFTTYEIDAEEGEEQHAKYRLAEKESLQITCYRAAQELSRDLFDGNDHTVGVNWGTIVKETIRHICPLPSHLGDATISIISLFGDLAFHPLDHDTSSAKHDNLNSNVHVAQLTHQLGIHGQPSLLNVPGFIPARFSEDKATFNALRSFMSSHASYQRIFGGPPPNDPQSPRTVSGISNRPSKAEITKIDTVITGFGSADNHTMLHEYLTSWLNTDEIVRLLDYQKRGKIVGDIGGHLVASYDARDDDELGNFLNRVNRRLIAAQPCDFVDVASRHLKTRESEGGGVVGITVGARKARILHTLLSWDPCPVSRLIIDSHCALALLYLIDSSTFHRFVEHEGRRFTTDYEEWSLGSRKLIPI